MTGSAIGRSDGWLANRLAGVTTAAVAVHLLAHAAHGVVHELIPVRIAAWQTAFVVVAMFVLPTVALGTVVRGRRRLGAVLLLVSGVASLLFEVVFHFVVENPDHVGSVSRGAVAFAGTAVVTGATDLLLIVLAAWLYRRSR